MRVSWVRCGPTAWCCWGGSQASASYYFSSCCHCQLAASLHHPTLSLSAIFATIRWRMQMFRWIFRNNQAKKNKIMARGVWETDSSERFFKCFDFLSPKVNIRFTGRCSRDPLSSHLVLNWKSLHGNPLWSPLINCWTISDAQVQLICEPADSSFQSLRQTLKIQFSNIFVVINWENLWVTNCRPGL